MKKLFTILAITTGLAVFTSTSALARDDCNHSSRGSSRGGHSSSHGGGHSSYRGGGHSSYYSGGNGSYYSGNNSSYGRSYYDGNRSYYGGSSDGCSSYRGGSYGRSYPSNGGYLSLPGFIFSFGGSRSCR